MGAPRVLFTFATAIGAAMLLAGCASTVELAQNNRVDCAPLAGAGAGIQMASLHGFSDVQPQREPISEPAATGENPHDTPICRSVPPATGSRLGTRTMCMTGDEWMAKAQNDRDQLTDAEARARASNPALEF